MNRGYKTILAPLKLNRSSIKPRVDKFRNCSLNNIQTLCSLDTYEELECIVDVHQQSNKLISQSVCDNFAQSSFSGSNSSLLEDENDFDAKELFNLLDLL
ncbi:Hypothetical_protein [Hexamita inflata]|uniref:Hypothetical_protein n=1 Tax=Hexamita inflata TaxID=28002 RepID=A0ABP1ISU7_9EUKA